MFKNFLFDYFYYRLFYLTNYESEYDENRSFRSIGLISLIQSMYIGIVLFEIKERWFSDIDIKPGLGGTIGGLIIVGLFIWNYRKYNNRMEEFDERWSSESDDARLIKGSIVAIISLFPLIKIFFF